MTYEKYEIQNSAFINKVLLEHATLIHVLPMAAFML